MSDLAAAAAAMGVPESIVQRSAEARAKATGASVDEILAAWAGGAAVPAASAPSPQPQVSSQTSEQPSSDDAPAPEADTEPVTVAADVGTLIPGPSSHAPSPPSAPPVLVGPRQGMGSLVFGSIGLLVLSMLLSVFLPSVPQPGNGIRTSTHAFSAQALSGRSIYRSQGCATCHTQLIRNVVSDVNLGPATLDDTNQLIGYRRLGPDLAAIGTRITDTPSLIALLNGQANHPPVTGLTDDDLANLLAYLRESR
ncbi:MAG: cbb3-type cytochrome c oxidase subunit II [Acidimicrobiia bacterium]